MSLSRAGKQRASFLRRITVADSSAPSGVSASGSVAVPSMARGSITHILVNITGTTNSISARFNIYGLLDLNTGELGGGQGETDIIDQWYALAQMNNGVVVSQSTATSLSPTNTVLYAESFSHISMYDRVIVLSDNWQASVTSVAIAVVFEAGQ